MLRTMLLFTVLMPGCLGGASDLQLFGKSSHSNKPSQSSDGGRQSAVGKQMQLQPSNAIRRSLDLKSLNIHVTPTSNPYPYLPTMIKLYPPTAKPLHLYANLPMRFGRERGEDRATPKSTPNLPQRFGRSWEMTGMGAECPDAGDAPSQTLSQRFGRNSLYRNLANKQLLKVLWRWPKDLDFAISSEEADMHETFKKMKGRTWRMD